MADPVYHARLSLPIFLTRGRDNIVTLDLRDSSGDVVAADSMTVDVYDGNGVKVVDGASAVGLNYTIAAAIVPATEPLSDLWQIVWKPVVSSVLYQYPQPMHLVRWNVAAPVTEADVTDRHSEASDLLASGQDLTTVITTAWEWVLRRLMARGRMPWLVLDPFSLFDAHLYRALHLLYLDAHASVGGSGKYGEMSDYYKGESERELAQVTLTYDDDEDGLPDADEQGTSAVGTAYMGGPGTWRL